MSQRTDDARAADAAAAYWGTDAKSVTAVSQLAPPPRALTIQMEEYVARKTKSPWGILIVLGVLVLVPALAAYPPMALGTIPFFAGAGYLRSRARGRAAKLRFVLEQGASVAGKVEHVSGHNHSTHSPIAGRMIVGDRVLTRVRVVVADGRRTHFETWDGGFGALLQPGLAIELLMHPDVPELIVPVAEFPA